MCICIHLLFVGKLINRLNRAIAIGNISAIVNPPISVTSEHTAYTTESIG